MRKIAIINQKGGVGKTTTAVNISRALSILGKKVLLIDLDPQSNTTLAFNLNPNTLNKTIYTILKNESQLSETVISVSDNLWLVPSNLDLAGADLEFFQVIGREFLLRDALVNLNNYDFVIIDCPPSLGLLNINALAYVEEVFIPIQCEFFALQGISLLLKTIEMVKKRLNPRLEISGVICCMFDPRTNLSKEVLKEVKNFFKEKVFKTVIRNNISLAEAPSFGKTIFEYAPKSHGAEDYLNLTKEFLGELQNNNSQITTPKPSRYNNFSQLLENVKAFSFDLWETLIFQTDEQKELEAMHRVNEIHKLLAGLGYEYSSDTILSAHDNAWNRCELIWEEGKDISSKEHVALFLNLIEDGLSKKIPEKEFAEIMDVYCGMALVYKPLLVDGTKELLEILKQKGYRVALISNTGRNPGNVLRKLLEYYDVLKYFDVTLFSNETLVRKPSKMMFEIALKRLEVEPNQCIHIGDRAKEDIQGANAVGMKTIYISKQTDDNQKCDLKIASIKDLLGEIRQFSKLLAKL